MRLAIIDFFGIAFVLFTKRICHGKETRIQLSASPGGFHSNITNYEHDHGNLTTNITDLKRHQRMSELEEPFITGSIQPTESFQWKGRIDNDQGNNNHVVNTLNEIKNLVKQTMKPEEANRFHAAQSDVVNEDVNSDVKDQAPTSSEDLDYVAKAQEIIKQYEEADKNVDNKNKKENQPNDQNSRSIGNVNLNQVFFVNGKHKPDFSKKELSNSEMPREKYTGVVINNSEQMREDASDNTTTVQNDKEESVIENIDDKNNVILSDSNNKVDLSISTSNLSIDSLQLNETSDYHLVNRTNKNYINMTSTPLQKEISEGIVNSSIISRSDESSSIKENVFPSNSTISSVDEIRDDSAEKAYASFVAPVEDVRGNNSTDANEKENLITDKKSSYDPYGSIDDVLPENNSTSNKPDSNSTANASSSGTTNHSNSNQDTNNRTNSNKKIGKSNKQNNFNKHSKKKHFGKGLNKKTIVKLKEYLHKKCSKKSTGKACLEYQRAKQKAKSNYKKLKAKGKAHFLRGKKQSQRGQLNNAKNETVILHYKTYEKKQLTDQDGNKRTHNSTDIKDSQPSAFAIETIKTNEQYEPLDNRTKTNVSKILAAVSRPGKLVIKAGNESAKSKEETQGKRDENEVKNEAKIDAQQTGVDQNTTEAALAHAQELANEVSMELSDSNIFNLDKNSQSQFTKLDPSTILENKNNGTQRELQQFVINNNPKNSSDHLQKTQDVINSSNNTESDLTVEEAEKIEKDAELASDEIHAANTSSVIDSFNQLKQLDISALPVTNDNTKANPNDIRIEPGAVDSFRDVNEPSYIFLNKPTDSRKREGYIKTANVKVVGESIKMLQNKTVKKDVSNITENQENGLGNVEQDDKNTASNVSEGQFTFSQQSDDEFRQEEPNDEQKSKSRNTSVKQDLYSSSEELGSTNDTLATNVTIEYPTSENRTLASGNIIDLEIEDLNKDKSRGFNNTAFSNKIKGDFIKPKKPYDNKPTVKSFQPDHPASGFKSGNQVIHRSHSDTNGIVTVQRLDDSSETEQRLKDYAHSFQDSKPFKLTVTIGNRKINLTDKHVQFLDKAQTNISRCFDASGKLNSKGLNNTVCSKKDQLFNHNIKEYENAQDMLNTLDINSIPASRDTTDQGNPVPVLQSVANANNGDLSENAEYNFNKVGSSQENEMSGGQQPYDDNSPVDNNGDVSYTSNDNGKSGGNNNNNNNTNNKNNNNNASNNDDTDSNSSENNGSQSNNNSDNNNDNSRFDNNKVPENVRIQTNNGYYNGKTDKFNGNQNNGNGASSNDENAQENQNSNTNSQQNGINSNPTPALTQNNPITNNNQQTNWKQNNYAKPQQGNLENQQSHEQNHHQHHNNNNQQNNNQLQFKQNENEKQNSGNSEDNFNNHHQEHESHHQYHHNNNQENDNNQQNSNQLEFKQNEDEKQNSGNNQDNFNSEYQEHENHHQYHDNNNNNQENNNQQNNQQLDFKQNEAEKQNSGNSQDNYNNHHQEHQNHHQYHDSNNNNQENTDQQSNQQLEFKQNEAEKENSASNQDNYNQHHQEHESHHQYHDNNSNNQEHNNQQSNQQLDFKQNDAEKQNSGNGQVNSNNHHQEHENQKQYNNNNKNGNDPDQTSMKQNNDKEESHVPVTTQQSASIAQMLTGKPTTEKGKGNLKNSPLYKVLKAKKVTEVKGAKLTDNEKSHTSQSDKQKSEMKAEEEDSESVKATQTEVPKPLKNPSKLFESSPIVLSKALLKKDGNENKEFNFMKIEPPSITSDHLDLDKQSDIASFPAEIRKHLNKQARLPKAAPSLSVKYEKPVFKLAHEATSTTIDGSHVHSINNINGAEPEEPTSDDQALDFVKEVEKEKEKEKKKKKKKETKDKDKKKGSKKVNKKKKENNLKGIKVNFNKDTGKANFTVKDEKENKAKSSNQTTDQNSSEKPDNNIFQQSANNQQKHIQENNGNANNMASSSQESLHSDSSHESTVHYSPEPSQQESKLAQQQAGQVNGNSDNAAGNNPQQNEGDNQAATPAHNNQYVGQLFGSHQTNMDTSNAEDNPGNNPISNLPNVAPPTNAFEENTASLSNSNENQQNIQQNPNDQNQDEAANGMQQQSQLESQQANEESTDFEKQKENNQETETSVDPESLDKEKIQEEAQNKNIWATTDQPQQREHNANQTVDDASSPPQSDVTNDVSKAMEELESLMKEKANDSNSPEKEKVENQQEPQTEQTSSKIPTSEEQIQMLEHPSELTDSQTKSDLKNYILNHNMKVLEDDPSRSLALFRRNETAKDEELLKEESIEKMLDEGNNFQLGEEIKLNYAKGTDNIEQEHAVEKVLAKYLKASDLLKRKLKAIKESKKGYSNRTTRHYPTKEMEHQSIGKVRGLTVPVNESGDDVYENGEKTANQSEQSELSLLEENLKQFAGTRSSKSKNKDDFGDINLSKLGDLNDDVNKQNKTKSEEKNAKANFEDLFSLTRNDASENNESLPGNENGEDHVTRFTDSERKEAEKALEEMSELVETDSNNKTNPNESTNNETNGAKGKVDEQTIDGKEYEDLMGRLSNAMTESTKIMASMDEEKNFNEVKSQSDTVIGSPTSMNRNHQDSKAFSGELKWFDDMNNPSKKIKEETSDSMQLLKYKETDPTKKMLGESDNNETTTRQDTEQTAEQKQKLASERLQKDIEENLKLAKEKIKSDTLNKERELLNLSNPDIGTGDSIYPPTLPNGRVPLQYNETHYFEDMTDKNKTLQSNESLVLKNDTLQELDKTFEATANSLFDSPIMKKLKDLETNLQTPTKPQQTTVDPYSTFKRSKLHKEFLKKPEVG